MTKIQEKISAPRNSYFNQNLGQHDTVPSLYSLSFDSVNLRRYARTILLCVVLSFVLAYLFQELRGVSYSASSNLIVENYSLQITQTTPSIAPATVTGTDVANQVEILKSWNVAARAFELLYPSGERNDLPPPNWISRLKQLVTFKAEDLDPQQLKRMAIAEFQERITVRKIGDTFTIQIGARSDTPEGAAQMVTAIANAYLEDQGHIRAESADATQAWLRPTANHAGITSRIISTAVPPLHRDGPTFLMALVAFLAAGLGIGVAIVLLREHLFRRISTPADARYLARGEWLGSLAPMSVAPLLDSATTAPSGRSISREGVSRWPFVDPRSESSETFNRICVAAMLEGKGLKSIGIASFLAGEGKSTVALNFARMASLNSQRVLLLDASNNRDLSSKIAPSATAGLSQVLGGDLDLKDAVWKDPDTGFEFLPLLSDEKSFAVAWLWAIFSQKITLIAQDYDIVVLDLPPLAETASFVAASQTLDGLVFVIEKERLRISEAERMLSTFDQSHRFYRGVVLNDIRGDQNSGLAPVVLKRMRQAIQRRISFVNRYALKRSVSGKANSL